MYVNPYMYIHAAAFRTRVLHAYMHTDTYHELDAMTFRLHTTHIQILVSLWGVKLNTIYIINWSHPLLLSRQEIWWRWCTNLRKRFSRASHITTIDPTLRHIKSYVMGCRIITTTNNLRWYRHRICSLEFLVTFWGAKLNPIEIASLFSTTAATRCWGRAIPHRSLSRTSCIATNTQYLTLSRAATPFVHI